MEKDIQKQDQKIPITISIIGGGISGIATVANLIKFIGQIKNIKLIIRLFERLPVVGPGFAYDPNQSRAFLINSTHSRIRILFEEDQKFYNWMVKNREKHGKEFPMILQEKIHEFIPRKLAGFYFIERAHELQVECVQKGIDYQIIHQEVVDIFKADSQKMNLKCKNGDKYETDYIFLCTGNTENKIFSHLTSCPNYFPFFYKKESLILKQVKDVKDVLIIGSRLSGIDCALMLADNNFQGSITIASRDGILPTVRSRIDYHEQKYFNEQRLKKMQQSGQRLSLEQFVEDFNNTLKEEIFDGQPITILDYGKVKDQKYQEQLAEEYQLILDKKSKWENVIFALQISVDLYWRSFTDEEKEIFLRIYSGVVWKIAGSMPYHNAKSLLELFKKGQLKMRPGLQDIKYIESDKKFRAAFDLNGQITTQDYCMVLNAAGHTHNIRNSSELYKNLSTKNMIEFNQFGSLDVDLNCNVKSKHSDRIYGIGHPTFGTFYLMNLFSGIIAQCESAAKHIKHSLQQVLENDEQRFMYKL